jgi:hypothetical protein
VAIISVPARKPKRRRQDYKRWQREEPMQLWQLDVTGSVFLADGTELKLVSGIDDHSRFCVIAAVVRRATPALSAGHSLPPCGPPASPTKS